MVGMRRAQELFLLNRRLTAQEALEFGLISWVVSSDAVEAEAAAVAAKLAAGPTMGLAVTKRMLEVEATLTLTEALHEEAWVQALCMKHPDYRESYEAFVAKRAPDFTKNAGARVEMAVRRAQG